MAEVLRIGVGLALTGSAIATAIFIARALVTKGVSPWGTDSGQSGWRLQVFIGVVFVGWLALVFVGVRGLLFWLPFGEEPIHTLAGLVALGSAPLFLHLERLPRMRRQLDVLASASSWERKQLDHGIPLSEAVLEQLAADASDTNKTATDREIAETKLGFARALKAREERLEALVKRNLQYEEERKAELAENARREQAKQAQQEADRRIDQALTALLASRPTCVIPQTLAVDIESVVQLEIVKTSWTLFTKHIVSIRPKLSSEVDVASRRLEAALFKLPGVTLPPGVSVQILFKGNDMDGYCDAVATSEGIEQPLGDALLYNDTMEGLLTAFFFGAALKPAWSWGHGYYDRDYEPALSVKGLRDALSTKCLPMPDDVPPGVRVRRASDDLYVLSCLATRWGWGLYDMSVEVKNGKASALPAREINVTGKGMYY